MRIGLVGKPNVGKSTTFAALTETPVDIANYPFTTIDPNVGVTYISASLPCACQELRARRETEGRLEADEGDDAAGSICQPRTGACNGHDRLVPVTLVDVAGLVPGAHEGRGRGNQFLSDLASCDALIQVVDGSGSTDIEGNPTGPGGCDPLEEHQFLVEELAAWLDGILEGGWIRATRRIQNEGEAGFYGYITDQLTGIGATSAQVTLAFDRFRTSNPDLPTVGEWRATERRALSEELRREIFPLFIAANKADLAEPEIYAALAEEVTSSGGLLVACSAESELALRRARKAGVVDYEPGATSFSIPEGVELNPAQQNGLDELSQRLERLGGTGLTSLLAAVVYDRLERIVAYPVQDESKWTDGDGRVLPDALLVRRGTTAKGLAYAVHSDLGDGFIRASDGRTGRVIGAEHELEDGSVVKIHAKT
jgi:ribosome-binding ATPase YchF (GTP1/OBG family)